MSAWLPFVCNSSKLREDFTITIKHLLLSLPNKKSIVSIFCLLITSMGEKAGWKQSKVLLMNSNISFDWIWGLRACLHSSLEICFVGFVWSGMGEKCGVEAGKPIKSSALIKFGNRVKLLGSWCIFGGYLIFLDDMLWKFAFCRWNKRKVKQSYKNHACNCVIFFL